MTEDFTHVPFVQAKGFTPGGSSRQIDLIVVHDMESPENATTAEDVARYFQGTDKASAHYNIDSDSIVQCVKLEDVAWGAPGANHNGVQLEHAGRASQTARDWADTYSRTMLAQSAKLSAWLAAKLQIPVKFIDAQGLRAGERGITTHAQCTLAFPGPGRDHTDPGPNFPMSAYIAAVKASPFLPVTDKPWPIPLPAWFWTWAEWRIGEGVYKGHGTANPKLRPELPFGGDGQEAVPAWAWTRLKALLDGRKAGV